MNQEMIKALSVQFMVQTGIWLPREGFVLTSYQYFLRVHFIIILNVLVQVVVKN